MIIDTHCHLNMQPLADDIEQVIINAKKAGVEYIQSICTKLTELPEILSIAEQHSEVYASVGLHPCNTGTNDIPTVEQLTTFANHIKIISFGETGLDYYKADHNIKAQKQSFINHIHAAQEVNLPIVVHTRDAEADTYDILHTEFRNKPFSGVIHCFTASEDFARKVLDIGFYISIAGIVTFKNAVALQDIVKQLPLDKLLVETDAPYLAPTPMRGKSNEPSFIYHTIEYLAKLHNKLVTEMMHITTSNAKTLFSKAKFE